MKIKAIILHFCNLVGSGGMSKANQQISRSRTPMPLPSPEAPFGGTAPTGEKLFFRGNIAGKLSIEMVLLT